MEDFERSYIHERQHPKTKAPTSREGETVEEDKEEAHRQFARITPEEARALSQDCGYDDMSTQERLKVMEVLSKVAARCGYQGRDIGNYIILTERSTTCRGCGLFWWFEIIALTGVLQPSWHSKRNIPGKKEDTIVSKLSTGEKFRIVEGLSWTRDPETCWAFASDGQDSRALIATRTPTDIFLVFYRTSPEELYDSWVRYTPPVSASVTSGLVEAYKHKPCGGLPNGGSRE